MGATTPITGLVRNRGSWPNGRVELKVHDRSPDASGATTLGVMPIPAIAPGEVFTAMGTLTATPLPAALYLEIDPAQAGEESNRANNLIVIGQIGGESVAPQEQRVYLPMVGR